jgi:hypothetical protein
VEGVRMRAAVRIAFGGQRTDVVSGGTRSRNPRREPT